MKKRLVAALLIALMIITISAPATFAASKNVKMKVFKYVIKSGNTVYCSGGAGGIYKVTLKNGKVKKTKRLVKHYSWLAGMKKKGKYIYYVEGSAGTTRTLARVNIDTGKRKALIGSAGYDIEYVIKNKKLYVRVGSFYSEKAVNKVMKLNGKAVKNTSVRPMHKLADTNTDGYSVETELKGKYYYIYLKTPKGKYKIDKIKQSKILG